MDEVRDPRPRLREFLRSGQLEIERRGGCEIDGHSVLACLDAIARYLKPKERKYHSFILIFSNILNSGDLTEFVDVELPSGVGFGAVAHRSLGERDTESVSTDRTHESPQPSRRAHRPERRRIPEDKAAILRAVEKLSASIAPEPGTQLLDRAQAQSEKYRLLRDMRADLASTDPIVDQVHYAWLSSRIDQLRSELT